VNAPGKVRIKVRKSAIHGRGAFATKDLAPGDLIGHYAGRWYSPKAVARRRWDQQLTYVIGLQDGSVIDAGEGGNATRHINHSCSPNCIAYEVEGEGGRLGVEIEATRFIPKGAEIFLDYALDAGEAAAADFPCACGAQACRSTMLATAAATGPGT
jgi:uncharacterized protein